jgi:hypothetical protein
MAFSKIFLMVLLLLTFLINLASAAARTRGQSTQSSIAWNARPTVVALAYFHQLLGTAPSNPPPVTEMPWPPVLTSADHALAFTIAHGYYLGIGGAVFVGGALVYWDRDAIMDFSDKVAKEQGWSWRFKEEKKTPKYDDAPLVDMCRAPNMLDIMGWPPLADDVCAPTLTEEWMRNNPDVYLDDVCPFPSMVDIMGRPPLAADELLCATTLGEEFQKSNPSVYLDDVCPFPSMLDIVGWFPRARYPSCALTLGKEFMKNKPSVYLDDVCAFPSMLDIVGWPPLAEDVCALTLDGERDRSSHVHGGEEEGQKTKDTAPDNTTPSSTTAEKRYEVVGEGEKLVTLGELRRKDRLLMMGLLVGLVVVIIIVIHCYNCVKQWIKGPEENVQHAEHQQEMENALNHQREQLNAEHQQEMEDALNHQRAEHQQEMENALNHQREQLNAEHQQEMDALRAALVAQQSSTPQPPAAPAGGMQPPAAP